MSNIADLKELSSSVDFWGTTTGFSSDRLCEILVFAVNSAQKLEAAEREHDDLRKVLQETQVGLIDAINHASQLQAELSRRDAAAGKPFAYVITDKDDREAGRPGSLSFRGVRAYKDDDVNEYELSEQPLYDSDPHAVLPPDITFESKGFVSLTSEDFAYNRALEDARKLGAQQQKVVELPESFKQFNGDNKPFMFREDVIYALDAAGVKYKVKK